MEEHKMKSIIPRLFEENKFSEEVGKDCKPETIKKSLKNSHECMKSEREVKD